MPSNKTTEEKIAVMQWYAKKHAVRRTFHGREPILYRKPDGDAPTWDWLLFDYDKVPDPPAPQVLYEVNSQTAVFMDRRGVPHSCRHLHGTIAFAKDEKAISGGTITRFVEDMEWKEGDERDGE